MDLLRDCEWYIHDGDCITHMAEEMPAESMDFSVFSPPFPSLYAYSSSEADIGNTDSVNDEAKLHLSFFFKSLKRVMKPGRVAVCHVCQIPRMKRSGGVGMCDFRGLCIRIGERAGLVYEYDWAITKNPQALRDGTGVWTPTGITPIDKLSAGDEVIGASGKPVEVMGVYHHESRQMYRVTFNDGESIECDGQHLWSVNKNVCRYSSPVVNKTTAEMFADGAMSPDGKTAKWSVPLCRDGVEFSTPGSELPLDPYLVGVLLGDGMLSSRGVVGVCTEREIVESLALPDGHASRKLKGSEKGNNVSSHHIRCPDEWHRNDVLSACRQLGIYGLRAWEKHIPSEYVFSSKENRLAVLQGLMDTDGTIKKNGSCYFASTSQKLAEGVQFLTESLGGICRISVEESPAYPYKGEIRYGRTRFVCCVRLPGICPFRLTSKAQKWKPLARTIHRRIVSIEKTGISDCTCITVSAKDGLFVTEHGIVTHNSQAIRTRSRELQFAGLESDRAKTRGAIADYLIKFRAPGENAVPINSPNQVSRNQWIDWAEAAWTDIRETNTLNTKRAKGENDVKHICPLQLDVIERLVRLYSNPGEIVFSPFAGIGSEGYVSLKLDRRFYGCELKEEYFREAQRNLRSVIKKQKAERKLF